MWGHDKVAGKAIEGGTHQTWGRQRRRGGIAADLGLLRRRRLDEEVGEREGGSTLLEKGRKWGRERKGAREAAVPILKGVGGVEQRRGWPGVVPRSEEVVEEHGGGGAAR
jgi:hypothetical protein